MKMLKKIGEFLETAAKRTGTKNKLSFVWASISLVLIIPAYGFFIFYAIDKPALNILGFAVDFVVLADLLAWMKYDGSFPSLKKPPMYFLLIVETPDEEDRIQNGVDGVLPKGKNEDHKEGTKDESQKFLSGKERTS